MNLPDWQDANFQAAAPLLDEWVGVYNLPRSLAFALVSQESRFNPSAFRDEPKIGDASYGLTQILYRTAQGLGYSGAPQGLYDPVTNVQFGFLYLRNALDRYGDWSQALSAYNSGRPTGSTAGATYAAQVLERAASFDSYFAPTADTSSDPGAADIVVNDNGTGGGVSVGMLVAVALGIGFLLWTAGRR